MFAGGRQLLEVTIHLGHREVACAFLATHDTLQARENALQLRVEVTAGIYDKRPNGSPSQALDLQYG